MVESVRPLFCKECQVDIGRSREKRGRQKEFCEACKAKKLRAKQSKPRKWAREQLADTKQKLKAWLTEFIDSADANMNPLQCAMRFSDAIENAFK
jgi:hypothetical protein